MYGVIYKVLNKLNKKIYIGQKKCKSKEEFFKSNYYGSGTLIKKAIKKYGFENFDREIIDIACSLDESNKKEIYWINKLKSRDNSRGYNFAMGGKAGIMSDKNHSEITKMKMKEKARHRKYKNICKKCHNEFISLSGRRKYCDNCQEIISNEERNKRLKACKICNEIFKLGSGGTGWNSIKLCKECRNKEMRKKNSMKDRFYICICKKCKIEFKAKANITFYCDNCRLIIKKEFDNNKEQRELKRREKIGISSKEKWKDPDYIKKIKKRRHVSIKGLIPWNKGKTYKNGPYKKRTFNLRCKCCENKFVANSSNKYYCKKCE